MFIIGHVPTNGCFNKWAKVYQAITDRFEYTIRA